MRRSASLLIPLSLILMYYAFWVGLAMYLLKHFPGLDPYLPFGGISDLAASNTDTFEPVYTSVERTLLAPTSPVQAVAGLTRRGDLDRAHFVGVLHFESVPAH